MQKKGLIIVGLALLLAAITVCSDGPRKTSEYIVVNVTGPHSDGYKHNLRNVDTGLPTHVVYPAVRFTNGDHVIMKRTHRKVTFTPSETYLY